MSTFTSQTGSDVDMSKSSTLFIGMDVHKETIDIDIYIATNHLNGKVRHYGQIQNRIDAIDKLVAT